MRLNLGSGKNHIDGYLNLDGNQGESIFPLSYSDVDEIRASHVLEHFGHRESIEVLKNWVSCLKVGGVLKIAVPDFMVIANNIDKLPQWEFYLFGGQTDELDYHKSVWYHSKLELIMMQLGLTDIKTWKSDIVDCASYPFSLNLEGVKSESHSNP